MTRVCDDCGRIYNDEYRSTICPHDGINGLCVEHDLYGCPHHKKEEQQPSQLGSKSSTHIISDIYKS